MSGFETLNMITTAIIRERLFVNKIFVSHSLISEFLIPDGKQFLDLQGTVIKIQIMDSTTLTFKSTSTFLLSFKVELAAFT